MKLYKLPLEEEDFNDIINQESLLIDPKSELPFDVQLLYLANIGLKCDIDISNLSDEELEDFCKIYLEFNRQIYIPSLSAICINSLLKYKDAEIKELKRVNLDSIDYKKYICFLDSLLAFIELRFHPFNNKLKIENDLNLETTDEEVPNNLISLIYDPLILEYMSLSKDQKIWKKMWNDERQIEDKNLITHVSDSQLAILFSILHLNHDSI